MSSVSSCLNSVQVLLPSSRNFQRGVAITLVVGGIIALIVGSIALHNQLFTSLSGGYKFPALSGINYSYSIMLIAGGGVSSLIGVGGLLHI